MSRFKEPSSWGSLGAMLIGFSMAPSMFSGAGDEWQGTLKAGMFFIGVAFCAIGIALRERK